METKPLSWNSETKTSKEQTMGGERGEKQLLNKGGQMQKGVTPPAHAHTHTRLWRRTYVPPTPEQENEASDARGTGRQAPVSMQGEIRQNGPVVPLKTPL